MPKDFPVLRRQILGRIAQEFLEVPGYFAILCCQFFIGFPMTVILSKGIINNNPQQWKDNDQQQIGQGLGSRLRIHDNAVDRVPQNQEVDQEDDQGGQQGARGAGTDRCA